jgi:hypothetical protein
MKGTLEDGRARLLRSWSISGRFIDSLSAIDASSKIGSDIRWDRWEFVEESHDFRERAKLF